MAWPRISIVTPSFNQAEYLEETIRSVLLQRYPNLEYIIIDGGSTDDSLEIIKRYAPWLTYWTSEPDSGQADAINKGFAACSGELLGFVNSDDIYAKDAFREVINTWMGAGRPIDALICGSVQDISATGLALPQCFKPVKMGTVTEWLNWEISLHQPGCFWTAETWRRHGPFPHFHFVFDRYFFSRIAAEQSTSFLIANATLSSFRRHHRSKTMTGPEKFFPEWLIAMESMRPYLSLKHRMMVKLIQWKKRDSEFSSTVMTESDVRRAIKLLIEHLLRYPSSIFSRPVLGASRRLFLKRLRT